MLGLAAVKRYRVSQRISGRTNGAVLDGASSSLASTCATVEEVLAAAAAALVGTSPLPDAAAVIAQRIVIMW